MSGAPYTSYKYRFQQERSLVTLQTYFYLFQKTNILPVLNYLQKFAAVQVFGWLTENITIYFSYLLI